MDKSDERPDDRTFTDAEIVALKGFWAHLFDLLDLNSAIRPAVADSPINNEMKELISKHGPERYAEVLWNFTMVGASFRL